MPEARIGMDADGLVTEWDDGAELIFGYARAGDRSPRGRADRPHRAASGALARAVARGGGPSALAGKTVEVPALDAYGRSFRVELTIAEVDAAPTRFVGTIARPRLRA